MKGLKLFGRWSCPNLPHPSRPLMRVYYAGALLLVVYVCAQAGGRPFDLWTRGVLKRCINRFGTLTFWTIVSLLCHIELLNSPLSSIMHSHLYLHRLFLLCCTAMFYVKLPKSLMLDEVFFYLCCLLFLYINLLHCFNLFSFYAEHLFI